MIVRKTFRCADSCSLQGRATGRGLGLSSVVNRFR